MEDLGRIVIDVNAAGGGGGGGGGSGGFGRAVGAVGDIIAGDLSKTGIRAAMGIPAVGGMVSEMLAVAAKASLIGLAVTAALGAVVGVAKLVAGTFRMLDNAAAGLTETLAEMSPAIMVTRMRNELMMFTSRMRMAGETGAILAAREDALGRIDRSMFRLGSVVGIMGAKFLTPIYNLLAEILKTVERNLDVGKMVVQFVSSVSQFIGRTFMFIGNLGLGTFYGVIAAILTQIASALGIVARNTTPEYQGNEPFIQDLRLMGVPI